MAGISIWSLLLIFVIVLLLFGTNKLRNIGGDLGSAIKNFKKSSVLIKFATLNDRLSLISSKILYNIGIQIMLMICLTI